MCWLFVPGSGDWNSGSASSTPWPDASVMSRGKLMPPRSLSARWKRGGWITRLSGLTCEPSMADRGVASWIASLAATRASRSPSPAPCGASPTPATSGPTSPGSSGKFSLSGASSRTSATIYEWDSERSGLTFGRWVTALRRACLLRRRSAPPRSASASSSWPTPKVPNGGRTVAGTRTETGREGKPQSAHLETIAPLWPTPAARDGRDGRCSWETLARNDRRPLNEYAVTLWATPSPSSPPAPPTSTPGPASSRATRGLNPRFCGWLMGFPIGWTSCEVTETQWCHWQRRMRGALSSLHSESER